MKKLSVIIFFSLSFTLAIAHANQVLLTANQPMKVTFRLAHKNQKSQSILGELQLIAINKNMQIPVSMDSYYRAGIVIVSINGHELPSSANQFDQPKQCSMTTDKTKSRGVIELRLFQHSINCLTNGGVFG